MPKKIFYIFWKDLLIRKNHYFATTLEVLLPTVLIVLTKVSSPDEKLEIDNDQISFEAYKDGKCIQKHSHFGNIIYEPSTPFTDVLISKAACYAGYKRSSVKPGNLSDESVYFNIGVKFNILSDDIPDSLNYSLFPTNNVWANMLKLWRFSGATIPRYSIPTLHVVVELQRAIDITYLHLKNISATKLNLENTDLFERGPRIFHVGVYLSLWVAFTLLVLPVVNRIVQEKSTGAKELMLMMGVERWQLWVSKFLDILLFLIISMSGVVIFLSIPLKEGANTLKISPFLLWCLIMYGLIGVTFFLFFISCFFKKATLAVYVTQAVSIVLMIVNVISLTTEFPTFVKYLMYLFPQSSLMQGVQILLNFDFYEKTVKFSEKLSGKEDTLDLWDVLCIMTFDMLLYVLLTWYLEQVKPGRYGIPQPYNFCFKKSYWVPSKVLTSYNNCSDNPRGGFELVPSNLCVGVSIQNVSKVYKTLDKGIITAVDCISVEFYRGEISALLGHNGAGKTTVFSMITGLAYPTSGKIIINGYDLGVNVREARRNLGLCPQQDMLFNDLTSQQILEFYGVVKGLTLQNATAEASDLITKLKLTDVKNTQACKLSGGQKRKLSLAIAVIGGSEVLILDEPTSGMDPEIRREIWEILLGFRGSRTILLTTHFMEEADALCDRIAIMDHGKMKCYGSPMFLKSKFGKGYVLNIVVLDLETTKDLIEYVKGFTPAAKVKSQNIRTLSFELPESEVNVFPALLSGLEKKQAKNEITSFCVSLSTLEDVFLRLRSGHEAKDDFDCVDSPQYKKLDIPEDLNDAEVSRCLLYFYQLWALIIKKWIFFLRCYKSFFIYCLTPALLIIMMKIFLPGNNTQTNRAINLSDSQSLIYSLDIYSPSLILYSNLHDAYSRQLLSELVRSFGSEIQEVDNVKDAIYKTFKNDFYTYSKKLNLALQFSGQEMKILHNEEAVHMLPVSLNLYHNFLLKLRYKNSSIETSIGAKFANRELFFAPRAVSKSSIDNLPDFIGGQTMFYLLGPVKERFYGAKEIQLMITSALLYWLSHFLFDIMSFILYILVFSIGLKYSESGDFILEHAGEILVSLLLWGSGLILFAYVLSTLSKNVAAAFSLNIIIYMLFSFVIYNVISLGGLPTCIQYLHPSCILKFGYANLSSGKKNNYILALLLYNLVLFTFLNVRDCKLLEEAFHRIINRFVKVNYFLEEAKDEYVKEEEAAVKKLLNKENVSSPTLLVSELKRWYFKNCCPSPAVRGISFALNRGECFGLLGVNGAGKTSTFKMLTGNLPLSHGSTYACSERLSLFNRQRYLHSVGYCPQTGGIIPMFTGKELLQLFARLKGVNKSNVHVEVQKWLEKMNLLEYENQKCGTYSGGNQRKLSTAIALIGDRPLIFLDEPTSGVDPLSRRAIWNAIGNIQREGQSVVLTSHSMDECEALCSRLAIMVSGRFRCIGETTTLKTRFGQGYCVQLKLSSGTSEEKLHSLKNSVLSTFESDCELMDEHLTFLQYHVTSVSLGWADLFSKLSVLKEKFSILESYTASATTLEQIFIYFARNQ